MRRQGQGGVDMKGMRKGIFCVLAVVCVWAAGSVFMVSGAAAAGANKSVSSALSPVATDDPAKLPTMMPFRVWVYPSQKGGVMSAGHYEYFYMQVMGTDVETPLAVPNQQPVLPVIALPRGEPAIPTH